MWTNRIVGPEIWLHKSQLHFWVFVHSVSTSLNCWQVPSWAEQHKGPCADDMGKMGVEAEWEHRGIIARRSYMSDIIWRSNLRGSKNNWTGRVSLSWTRFPGPVSLRVSLYAWVGWWVCVNVLLPNSNPAPWRKERRRKYSISRQQGVAGTQWEVQIGQPYSSNVAYKMILREQETGTYT